MYKLITPLFFILTHSLFSQELMKDSNSSQLLDNISIRINQFSIGKEKNLTPDIKYPRTYELGCNLDFQKNLWKGMYVVISNSYRIYHFDALSYLDTKLFGQWYNIGGGLGWKQQISPKQFVLLHAAYSKEYSRFKKEASYLPEPSITNATNKILSLDLGYMLNINQRHGMYLSLKRNYFDVGLRYETSFTVGYHYNLNTKLTK